MSALTWLPLSHEGALRPAGPTVIDDPTRLRVAETVFAHHGSPVELSSRLLQPTEAARVHDLLYLDGLEEMAERNQEGWLDPELYFDRSLWTAARAAAASTVDQTQAALQSGDRVRWCLNRPGSHHASPGQALGGCVLNNLAIAAQSARASGCPRVAIVDFDVHHGNGSEDCFYDTAEVLTVSVHRHPFFPCTGASSRVGIREGVGANLNIPLPAQADDELFLAATAALYEKVIAFAPELILFEAGFDAHQDDPTSDTNVTTAGYAQLGATTRQLLTTVQAPAVFELGGSYDPQATAAALNGFLDGLEGSHAGH